MIGLHYGFLAESCPNIGLSPRQPKLTSACWGIWSIQNPSDLDDTESCGRYKPNSKAKIQPCLIISTCHWKSNCNYSDIRNLDITTTHNSSKALFLSKPGMQFCETLLGKKCVYIMTSIPTTIASFHLFKKLTVQLMWLRRQHNLFPSTCNLPISFLQAGLKVECWHHMVL